MKTRKEKCGYYDSYRYAKTKDEIKGRQKIIIHKAHLNEYWKKMVEEKDQMPQKEGTKLRKHWFYDGTNYRRLVEPLDIAERYKNGKTNYIKDTSDHYKLLERWSDEDKKISKASEVKRNKATSLTEDSCFWAHVDEALISLKDSLQKKSFNGVHL
ncbi:putative carboxylesterase [Helianthus anomalus]